MITWWILFVVFGLIAVIYLLKWLFQGMARSEVLLMVFSIIIAAITAGKIWG